MSDVVILDTSVLVDLFRFGRHVDRIASLQGLIRNSSVVLSELWRGVETTADHKLLETLRRNHPVLTPTENNWIESGQLLNRIRAAVGYSPGKLRDLHFDVLIALTARSYGARVITCNGADFELIRRHRYFDLAVWQ